MQHLLLAPLSAAFLFAPISQEQTPSQDPAKGLTEDAARSASKLLLAMAEADLVLEGDVSFEEPKPKDKPAAEVGGAVIVDIGFGGEPFGLGAPFVGALEVVLRKTGERLIQSESAAPGFTVYSGSSLVLKRTTYIDKPPAMAPVVDELIRVFDLEGLAKEVAAAEVQVRESGGRTIYTAPLRTTYFLPKKAPQQGGIVVMMGMEATVLEAQLELVVDAEGKCQQLGVRVKRNDPQAEMMQGMQVIQGGNIIEVGEVNEEIELPEDFAVEVPQLQPAKREKIEGGTSVYTFHTLDLDPTKRATRALAEMGETARRAALEGK